MRLFNFRVHFSFKSGKSLRVYVWSSVNRLNGVSVKVLFQSKRDQRGTLSGINIPTDDTGESDDSFAGK